VLLKTFDNGFKLVHNLSDGVPFYLVPDPDNGEKVSSWIASTYTYTDVISFCEILTAKMMTFREMIFAKSQSLENSAIFHYALGIESGPCGFLTLLPVVEGQAQYVSVVHTLPQCLIRLEVFAFVGDTQPPRLPTIKLEPKNGLEPYLRPTYKSYCDGGKVNTFCDSHPGHTLLPNECQKIKRRFGSLISIPTVWVPAFTEPLLPNQARKGVMELCHMMPELSQYLLQDSIMEWTIAACTEQDGDGPDSGSSILTIPWQNVPVGHQFLLWAEGEVMKLYPLDTHV
jgi:hypothetical protein